MSYFFLVSIFHPTSQNITTIQPIHNTYISGRGRGPGGRGRGGRGRGRGDGGGYGPPGEYNGPILELQNPMRLQRIFVQQEGGRGGGGRGRGDYDGKCDMLLCGGNFVFTLHSMTNMTHLV